MLSVLAAKLVQDRRAAAPADRALVRRDKHVLVPLNPRRSGSPGAGTLPAALALVPLALPTLPCPLESEATSATAAPLPLADAAALRRVRASVALATLAARFVASYFSRARSRCRAFNDFGAARPSGGGRSRPDSGLAAGGAVSVSRPGSRARATRA